MTGASATPATLTCRRCGEGVLPMFVGFIVESWRCPAGHEQHRTLGRRGDDWADADQVPVKRPQPRTGADR